MISDESGHPLGSCDIHGAWSQGKYCASRGRKTRPADSRGGDDPNGSQVAGEEGW
ncbi:hypothetical protein AB4Z43_28505 [Mesorhizobium sp. 2RAF45]|uniref:hypothetical protein n=1 Tax=Mesorhizobium sp. 2RAF45 TaxID=3233001 RepID=UPI003F9576A5